MFFFKLPVLVVLSAVLAAAGQETSPLAAPADMPAQLRSTYVLGPDDQIVIRALEAEEISEKPLRIDPSGFIRMPLIGEVQAGGLTLNQLENEVRKRLLKFFKNPQVGISLVEYRSQPVSVIGAVRTPGIQQLQGQKTLIEMLSLAGGLMPDAGYAIKITRRKEWGKIPIAGAVDDSTGEFNVAEVRVRELMEARNPSANIMVKPRDVITVPRAEMIYVMGEVKKPGAFTLRDDEKISLLEALSLAEGLSRTALPRGSKILRVSTTGSGRTEIPVDLGKVLSGKAKDGMLQASDILFVPNNIPKSAAIRGIEAAIGIGTGLAVYRR